MTADLATFLRARLDEDEAAARVAAFRHGHWMQGFGSQADAAEVYEVTQADLDTADGCEGSHTIGEPNPCEFNVLVQPGGTLEADPRMDGVAAHIARWDPARVLAEVKAKRALLDVHPTEEQRPYEADVPGGMFYPPEPFYCACQAEDGMIYGHEPCDTKRLLALPYADHPDYDSAWTPDPA